MTYVSYLNTNTKGEHMCTHWLTYWKDHRPNESVWLVPEYNGPTVPVVDDLYASYYVRTSQTGIPGQGVHYTMPSQCNSYICYPNDSDWYVPQTVLCPW